eukprot:2374791-Pleurochrysis_carterae.AAC.2
MCGLAVACTDNDGQIFNARDVASTGHCMHCVWWAAANGALDWANAREVTANIQVHGYADGWCKAISLNARDICAALAEQLLDEAHHAQREARLRNELRIIQRDSRKLTRAATCGVKLNHNSERHGRGEGVLIVMGNFSNAAFSKATSMTNVLKALISPANLLTDWKIDGAYR